MLNCCFVLCDANIAPPAPRPARLPFIARQEGIYGWAAVNFLKGDLLALSKGAGTADIPANKTVGTLDLGGASTQISFYKRDQVSFFF